MKEIKAKYSLFQRSKYFFFVDIALFMGLTFGFHKLWWFYADQIKSVDVIIDLADYLAVQVYNSSFWLNGHILNLSPIEEEYNTMRFANEKAIFVAESCSGLKQFFQVLILFIFFPGPLKHKIWYIPLGFMAIHLVNIFRVCFLSLWLASDWLHWDFAHDWIMRPFYYVVIFCLWYYWNERIRLKPKFKFK